jgi:hypothetical protein
MITNTCPGGDPEEVELEAHPASATAARLRTKKLRTDLLIIQ